MRHRGLVFLLGGWPSLALAEEPCPAESVSWAATSNRIYVAGEVTCTLGDIDRLLPDAPLEVVSPGVWLLGTNLHLQQGATLVVDGTARGGDADELRLVSPPGSFVELRAEWGTILLRGTRVTSWDPATDGPDVDHTDGRSYVRVVSFLDGTTPRESHMDVIESDIGYLGHYAAESYGLTWKVRDPTPDVFDLVDVHGSIVDSTVHHNYFGMYSYGAYGMRIAGSEFHSNVQYGIDPHDDSDALVIEDNITRDNGNHGFICSKRCDGLTVRRNVSERNAGIGFMFHRAVTDSVMEDNLARDNGDAGFAIMDSHDNVIRNNVAVGNATGVRLSVGASGNLVENNDLRGNLRYGVYFYQGQDAPTINDGRPTGNVIVGNDLSGSGEVGLRVTLGYANEFLDNEIRDNVACAVHFSNAEANLLAGNDTGGACIRADGVSDNTIVDGGRAAVQLQGPDAAFTFADAAGHVFENDARRVTEVDDEGSFVTFTGAETSGVVRVDVVGLRVVPDGGTIAVAPVVWGPLRREWTTTPGSTERARFEIGGLAPRSAYVLRVDGEERGVVTANRDGRVIVFADVTRPRSFVLEAQIRPAPAPIRRARVGAR